MLWMSIMRRAAERFLPVLAIAAFLGCEYLIPDLSNEDITVDHDTVDLEAASDLDVEDAGVDGQPECSGVDADACMDDTICNGEETCNVGLGVCEDGTPLEDGFVCGEEPRRICLAAECSESVCGDGFIDEEADESCEPPNVGGCDDECKLGCDGPDDCPDDEIFCNGEEYCNLDTHTCDRLNVPEDGDECGTGLVCCSGDCVECCDTTQCADGNECTNDVCNEGACANPNEPEDTTCDDGEGYCCVGECLECCKQAHCLDTNECTADVCTGEGTCRNPKKDDMVECTGGVCCNGTCRTGGNCCANTDCTDGCRGMAAACGTFGSGTCASQTGCSWDAAGPCSGVGERCINLIEDHCNACGDQCSWISSGSPPYCSGIQVICDLITSSLECNAFCGCTWDAAGPCSGTHNVCPTYSTLSVCNNQESCYWSVCTSYSCT